MYDDNVAITVKSTSRFSLSESMHAVLLHVGAFESKTRDTIIPWEVDSIYTKHILRVSWTETAV